MAEGKNHFLAKLALTSAGIVLVGAAAAAAGVAVGLKKWAEDEEATDLKIACGKRGFSVVKGDKPGEFHLDTRYDWQNDPDFAVDESPVNEDDALEDAEEAEGEVEVELQDAEEAVPAEENAEEAAPVEEAAPAEEKTEE